MSILDELRREFPAFTVDTEQEPGGSLQYVLWRGSGRKPENCDHMCVVIETVSEDWIAQPFIGEAKYGFASAVDAAVYATGAARASTCRVINADAPPDIRKDFTAKPRLTLIPPGVLADHLLPVLHDGAKKHGRDHWQTCSAREYAEAAATHLLAFLDGNSIDESGNHALAHAMADCALALGIIYKEDYR